MPGVEQQTNITIGANAKPLTDELRRAGQAAQQFEDAIDKMSSTTDRAAQSVTMTANQYTKLVQALDPAARSAAQYAQAEQLIQRAVQAGMATQEQANRMLDQANQKYNTLAAQAQKAAQAQADAAAKAAQQQASAYRQVQALLDPQAAKAQQLAAVQKTLNAELAANPQKQAEVNKLLAEASRQFGAVGGAAKISSFQMMLAFDQVRQAGDQMLAGGGFFRPIIMQAPVAVQMLGGLSNAMGLLRQNIGNIVSYGGIAAFAGALALIATAAERNQRSLNDLSNGLAKYGGDFKGTADTINAAARDLAATTSLGTQESREAMQTLAESPYFIRTQKNFEDTVKVAQQFSKGFGESLQQSAQRIQQIFADPVAAATQYAKQNIQGFGDAFTRQVNDLINQGKRAEAINLVFTRLAAALQNVNTAGTPLQAALKNLNEALTAVGNGAGNATNGIGTGLTNALAGAVNVITGTVQAVDHLLDAMSKIGVSGNVQGALLLGVFAQMLSPIRTIELAILKWAAAFVTARVAATATTAAVEAATVTSVVTGAVRGGATAAGGAALAGVETAGLVAAVLNPVTLTIIIAAVVAAVGTYLLSKGSTGKSQMETGAEAAGFQQYGLGAGVNRRYFNPRTGEDLSTQQMNARLQGKELGESFTDTIQSWFNKNMPSWLGGGDKTATPGTGGRPSGPITLNLLPGAGGQYADVIAANEKKFNLPAGLLAGVASIETGGKFNADAYNGPGDPRDPNRPGATGLMQILKSTGESPGYGTSPLAPADRLDPVKAIEFAAQYIDNVRKSTGSLTKAIEVYSGGGYHLAAGAGGTTTTGGGGTGGAVGGGAPLGTGGPAKELTPLQQAQKGVEGLPGDTQKQIADLRTQIDTLEQYKKTLADAAAQTGVSAEDQKQYNEQIGSATHQQELLRAQIEGLKTPYQQITQQQREQLTIESELNPVQKAILQQQQQLIDQNRNKGLAAPAQAELDAVKSGVLLQYAAQFRGIVAVNEQEAAAQNKLAAAYAQGGQAVDSATNYQKAWNQVVGAGKNATEEQKLQVEALAKSYDDVSTAAKHAQAAQELVSAQSQSRLLDVQRANLSGSATQQAVANAQAQAAEQAKQRGYNAEDTQKLVQQAGSNAAKTVDVDREKAAWQSVDQAAGAAIDDIGNGLEQVLSTGKWDDFKSAAKQALGEISKWLLQMAVLNPLKNLLSGGRQNYPSLFDLFNGTNNSNNPLSGGLVNSGGQTSGGSGSGGGLNLGGLGGLGNLFSKEGFFGSQGPLFGSGGLFGSSAMPTLSGNIVTTAAGNVYSGGELLASGALNSGIEASASSFASSLPALSASDSLLATGLYHTGGIAGYGSINRTMPFAMFSNAPRFHSGWSGGSGGWSGTDINAMAGLPQQFANDEVPAILQRGEMVLTKAQQKAVQSRFANNNGRPMVNNVTFNISTPDANSFRKSQHQINAEMSRTMIAASRRL